jgi:DNA-binding transcriptional LysR family regulator
LNLELVRTFLAVARAGGMRRAATSLHRTQPAISARIRELESQVGAPLFERLGRGLLLTRAGELLLAEAPALLATEVELARRLRETGDTERSTLRLATLDAASIYVLPQVYLEFRKAHPRVQLTVQVVDSRRVLAAVQELQVDVGVLALPIVHADVDTVPIFEDSMVCVAARGHPLAARRSVLLATVAAEPLVLYGRGSTTRATLDAVFQHHGLIPNVAMETASPEAMKRLAEVGVGIAIVPEELVREEIASGRLSRIAVSNARFARRLATAVRRGRELPAVARGFLDLVYRRYPPLGIGSQNLVGPERRGAHRTR